MPRATEWTEVKTIDYLERMNLSANGNPRFRVGFTDGTSTTTAPDAGIAYAISNPEYRDVPVRVTFMGKRGHIVNVETVE